MLAPTARAVKRTPVPVKMLASAVVETPSAIILSRWARARAASGAVLVAVTVGAGLHKRPKIAVGVVLGPSAVIVNRRSMVTPTVGVLDAAKAAMESRCSPAVVICASAVVETPRAVAVSKAAISSVASGVVLALWLW